MSDFRAKEKYGSLEILEKEKTKAKRQEDLYMKGECVCSQISCVVEITLRNMFMILYQYSWCLLQVFSLSQCLILLAGLSSTRPMIFDYKEKYSDAPKSDRRLEVSLQVLVSPLLSSDDDLIIYLCMIYFNV